MAKGFGCARNTTSGHGDRLRFAQQLCVLLQTGDTDENKSSIQAPTRERCLAGLAAECAAFRPVKSGPTVFYFRASAAMPLIIRNAQMTALKESSRQLVLPCDIVLRVAVRDHFHRPRAGSPYQLVAAGTTDEGVTDADGAVVAKLPRGTVSGRLVVWPWGEKARPQIWLLEIGEMNAAATKKGAIERLLCLGFLAPDEEGVPDAYACAVANFQAWAGLQVDGRLDEKTAETLELACRPPLSANPAQSSLPSFPDARQWYEDLQRVREIDNAPPPEDDEE